MCKCVKIFDIGKGYLVDYWKKIYPVVDTIYG